MLVSGK